MSSNLGYSKKILKILAQKPAVSIDSLLNNDNPKINYAFSRSIKNLKEGGFIKIHKSDQKDYLKLTDLGKNKYNLIKLECDDAIISTNWDGYWRVIIIDFPENRKQERDAIRYLLKKAGFVCIKNSVWISMYPYENLFYNIKKDLKIKNEMIILITDKIDDDTQKEFLINYSNS